MSVRLARRPEDLRLERHARATRTLREVDWPLRAQSGPIPDLRLLHALRQRRRLRRLRGVWAVVVLAAVGATYVALAVGLSIHALLWPWLVPLSVAVVVWVTRAYPR